MKDKNHIAVCDFMLLCASVDNIYDIGGKQYGRKTLHYIQDGCIPSSEEANNERQKSDRGR